MPGPNVPCHISIVCQTFARLPSYLVTTTIVVVLLINVLLVDFAALIYRHINLVIDIIVIEYNIGCVTRNLELSSTRFY
jgi:hypothetical protein